MFERLKTLPRYIATPRVAEHRLFVWLDAAICTDSALIAIARDNDTTAHSGESDHRFRRKVITSWSEATRRLVELRDRWLNPPEWVEWVEEPVPGYPKRPVARGEAAAQALKDRTLTKLYNARPRWLQDAHGALDEAVATAYGWPGGIAEEDALARLLALNADEGTVREGA